MPIFEYKCESCAKVFEELITGDRDRRIPCPACGSTQTGKLMSRIGGISLGSSGSGGCEDTCSRSHGCAMAGAGGCPGMCQS